MINTRCSSSTVVGAFGEYTLASPELQIKIPDNLGFEEAATLGVGITTVVSTFHENALRTTKLTTSAPNQKGQGLYQSLELPLPATPLTTPEPILIWGGSTATGILAIQFAKLSGFRVITTSSPHNFAYLESLGADATLDYRAADQPGEEADALAAEIRALAGDNKLARAWDCSPTPASARACALAMGGGGGGGGEAAAAKKYSSILPIDPGVLRAANPRVESAWTLGYTCFGETFERMGRVFEASAEDKAFSAGFWEVSRELLADGRVKVARMTLDQGGGGLEGVLKGLDDMKQGKVSGTKLVYRI